MKIAYLAELDASRSSGILNKITTQLRTWKALGVEAQLFIVLKPPGGIEPYPSILDEVGGSIHYSYFANLISQLTQKNQNYLNKVSTVANIKRALRDYHPDVIYYRFGIWFPGQIRRFGNKPVIVEINSNDLDEYKLYDKLAFWITRVTRDLLLKRGDGFCSVTAELHKSIVPKDKRGVVIGNGVAIPLPNKETRIAKKERAQLIFVGSSDCSWHGVDKILQLAGILPNYDFHFVGGMRIDATCLAKNIIFHNYLDTEKLSQLYENMDVAIGTLALHRKNMMEASPLKVREYLAHGLPVVIGYRDTDLDGKSFVLNIGNNERNAVDSAKRIVDFVDLWKNKKVSEDLSCINIVEKETRRLEFFGEIVRSKIYA